jgi:hypothetical protein
MDQESGRLGKHRTYPNSFLIVLAHYDDLESNSMFEKELVLLL